MYDSPDQMRGHFTQEELAAFWRGHLTLEELAAIKKESDDLFNGWIENLSPEESAAWIEAHAEDLERELRQLLGL
jgi:hypothetical protein